MDRTFNVRRTKKRRQYLRSNMTKGEKLLWARLRDSRLNGLKFRRQCGIETYIVDFYCPELKLAIEIDGDVHGYETRRIHDVDREKSLEKLGIKVLRFTNGEVTESINGVLEQILSDHPLPPSLSKEWENCGAAPDPCEGENSRTPPDPCEGETGRAVRDPREGEPVRTAADPAEEIRTAPIAVESIGNAPDPKDGEIVGDPHEA